MILCVCFANWPKQIFSMSANVVTHFPHFIALKWILLHNVSNSINGQLLEWGLTNLHMVNPLSKHLVIHVIRICHHYNDVLREGVGVDGVKESSCTYPYSTGSVPSP